MAPAPAPATNEAQLAANNIPGAPTPGQTAATAHNLLTPTETLSTFVASRFLPNAIDNAPHQWPHYFQFQGPQDVDPADPGRAWLGCLGASTNIQSFVSLGVHTVTDPATNVAADACFAFSFDWPNKPIALFSFPRDSSLSPRTS
ncbi:MAG: hypothetical protein SGILL_008172, partial [Bacillariaceae sp.]